MCSMFLEKATVEGCWKRNQGWFNLKEVNVYFDHPDHADLEHAINIDFVNEELGIDKRVAVELSPESAVKLIKAIENAMAKGL